MDTQVTAEPSGPLARPTLLPGLRRIWRDRHHLQLGLDPARAVIVELPDPTTARLLDLLDGSRSERLVLAAARRRGVDERHGRALLAALRRAGLVVSATTLLPHHLPDRIRRRLTGEASALALHGPEAAGNPAQILRRRSTARVLVTGHGPLAEPVALALAQAGVGHVRVDLTTGPSGAGPSAVATDVGPAGDPRAPADDPTAGVAAAIERVAPGTRTGPLRRRDASFVVQLGVTGPANLVAAGYARHRLAHLAVSVRDGTAVVGPLVPPTGGPCLNCVDLHRRDRDPQWPEVAAQLATPADEPCPAATVCSAAGLAAGETLSWLDGGTPDTIGGSIDVTTPGRLRRRTWPPHPSCPCFARYLRNRPPGLSRRRNR